MAEQDRSGNRHQFAGWGQGRPWRARLRNWTARHLGGVGRGGLVGSTLLLLTLLLAPRPSVPATRIATPNTPNTFAPGEVIIRFHDATPADEREAILADLGATRIRTYPSIRVHHSELRTLSVDQAIARYSGHSAVDFIEPNYRYSTQVVPNDPDFHLSWGLSNLGQSGGTPGVDISAPRVWDIVHDAPEVRVAVIDTGIDYTHPDLAANIFVNPGETPDNGLDDDGNGFVDDVHGWDFANNDNDPMDDHGHGSHVAGTLGAVGNNAIGMSGVAWQVQLIPLKFLGADGFGSTTAAISCIDYAIQMNARIMNNSWGGPGFSQALRLAVQRAEAAGIVFVAAAGNATPPKDNDVSPFYPASYGIGNIISVAATDSNDEIAPFSNYGQLSVDLAAPGVDIYGTFPGNDYGFLNGTSMATPHVAGALALIMGLSPDISGEDARELLLTNVDLVDGLAEKTVTGGRLNAYLPLAEPDGIAPARITDLTAFNPESSRIDLSWSAVGDDGLEGQARRYEVRYALQPLDDTNFTAGTRAFAPPAPQLAGQLETMRVSGLDASTTYFFAVRAFDEFGNGSPVSNVAMATTVGPPDLVIEPASLNADLFTGESTTLPLTLRNQGVGELLFEVQVSPTVQQHIVGAASQAPTQRPQADRPQPDSASHPKLAGVSSSSSTLALGAVEGQGGVIKEVTDATAADGTGYSYHEANSLAGHYTGVHWLFEPWQPKYISFWVRPGSDEQDDAYFVLRDPSGVEAIFFYATRTGSLYINADVGGDASVEYDAETWYSIELRNIDFETKDFDYYVNGFLIREGVPFRWSNVENLRRLDLYNFQLGGEAWWDEIVISTEQPPVTVSVEPEVGVVPAGGSVELAVNFNASRLNGGDYATELQITSNDPDNGEALVQTLLHVTGAPDLQPEARLLDFGAHLIGADVVSELKLTNRGTDRLSVTGSSIDNAAFRGNVGEFSLDPGEDRTVELRFRPQAEGPVEATLTITSDDPDEPNLEVVLLGTGQLPPDISVSPPSLNEELFTGQQANRSISIENTGFSQLDWELVFPSDGDPPLTELITALDQHHTRITDTVPRLFAFTGGTSGVSISSSGLSLFDGGNFLSTDIGAFVAYSNRLINSTSILGPEGEYFTAKYSGLFVFAADISTVNRFIIAGNLLPNTQRRVDSTVLQRRRNGVNYSGFVKRSFSGGIPSVNHLIIARSHPDLEQVVSTVTSSDYHELRGLSSTHRIYYLLFSSSDGSYIDDLTMSTIFDRFLEVLPFEPEWLETSPLHGTAAPGESSIIEIGFDAFEHPGGLFETDLLVASNVPGDSTVTVPISFEVTAASDVFISPDQLVYPPAFLGDSVDQFVSILNRGARTLEISDINTDSTSFVAQTFGTSLRVDPGSSTLLRVSFEPQSPGEHEAILTFASNDPDRPELNVGLSGTGLEAPVISVAPQTITATLDAGELTTRTLAISNLAGSDLTFNVVVLSGNGGAASLLPESVIPIASTALLPEAPAPSAEALQASETRSELATFNSSLLGTAGQDVPFTFNEDFEDGNLDGWFGVVSSAEAAAAEAVASMLQLGATSAAAPVELAETEPAGASTDNESAAAVIGLSVWPIAGTVVAGSQKEVTLTLDATNLIGGEYAWSLAVRHNDPLQDEIPVQVNLTVNGEPAIGTSRSTLDFGQVAMGLSKEISFTVTNFGTGDLTVSNIYSTSSQFVTDTAAFVLEPGRSAAVNVRFTPIEEAEVFGELVIEHDATGAEERIQLTGRGLFPPLLQVNPLRLDVSQFRGQTQVQPLRVSNVGGQTLSYATTILAGPGSDLLETSVLFSEDFEGDVPGWTTQTFAGESLWHRSHRSFVSFDTSWSCSIPEQGNYATGGQVSTALVSPPIDLRRASEPITLRFFENYQTEPEWDNCMVDVTTDNGLTWTPLRGSYRNAPSGDSRGWRQVGLDLSSYSGEIVQVRFYFETGDGGNNEFLGWFVDDVEVVGIGAPWVSLGSTAGSIEVGSSIDLEATFDATDRPSGRYEASIEIVGNDPIDPLAVVPVVLDVLDPPRLLLPGAAVSAESDAPFSGTAAITMHSLTPPAAPAGTGVMELLVQGRFANPTQKATLTAEAFVLGSVQGSGFSCGAIQNTFNVRATELLQLADDGVVDVFVRNSSAVDSTCPANRHSVRLTYPSAVEQLDFGVVAIGGSQSVPLTLLNDGSGQLIVESIVSTNPQVRPSVTAAQVEASQSQMIEVEFTAEQIGPLEGELVLSSNDPTRPAIRLNLVGAAVLAAQAQVDDTLLEAALPPRSARTKVRKVRLDSLGPGSLTWNASVDGLATVAPDSGTLEAGESVELEVTFRSSDLDSGDYTGSLEIQTNDPNRPTLEIPLVLHASEVNLASLDVDFTPKYAMVPGTVEVAIELPRGLDPRQIDLSTVSILDLVAMDVPVTIQDNDGDGSAVLYVQFDAREFDALFPPEPRLSVTVQGEVTNQTWFTGTTFVRGVAIIP